MHKMRIIPLLCRIDVRSQENIFANLEHSVSSEMATVIVVAVIVIVAVGSSSGGGGSSSVAVVVLVFLESEISGFLHKVRQ